MMIFLWEKWLKMKIKKVWNKTSCWLFALKFNKKQVVLTTALSQIRAIRSSTPFTPSGIWVKSSLPIAFWATLKVQWALPVTLRSPLQRNNTEVRWQWYINIWHIHSSSETTSDGSESAWCQSLFLQHKPLLMFPHHALTHSPLGCKSADLSKLQRFFPLNSSVHGLMFQHNTCLKSNMSSFMLDSL